MCYLFYKSFKKKKKKITLTYLQRKTEMFPISSTGDLGTPWHPCISDETQDCLRALGVVRLVCAALFIIWQCARLFQFLSLTAPTYQFFATQHIPVLPLQWDCRVEALPWSARSCSALPWTSFQANTNSVGRESLRQTMALSHCSNFQPQPRKCAAVST